MTKLKDAQQAAVTLLEFIIVDAIRCGANPLSANDARAAALDLGQWLMILREVEDERIPARS